MIPDLLGKIDGCCSVEATMSQEADVDIADYQHFAWLARSFGRTDYLPLTATDLEALAAAGSYIDRYPGTHLFKEGEDSSHAYVVQQGEVELYRTRTNGRRVVGRVRPGAVIGDIAMFQGRPYISSARAVTPVRAFRLDRARLLPLLIRLMHRTVREQVAEVLLDEADDFGEVHLSQGSLADLLGASRQSVNEALGDFRSDGAIDTGYRVIRIKDRSHLEDVSGR